MPHGGVPLWIKTLDSSLFVVTAALRNDNAMLEMRAPARVMRCRVSRGAKVVVQGRYSSGHTRPQSELADILKCEFPGHFPCNPRRKGPNLGVDVREVSQRCPSPDPHDCAIRCPTEFHCHCATSPKAVRRHAVESVSPFEEEIRGHTPLYRHGNAPVRNPCCPRAPVAYQAECTRRIHAM